ncbi:MAG TPA: formylglycine-generating enzyme family protein [Myxococcota bacterium]|nr:formylglycine-generating enzyme family protein [Myxococcota bacterium]
MDKSTCGLRHLFAIGIGLFIFLITTGCGSPPSPVSDDTPVKEDSSDEDPAALPDSPVSDALDDATADALDDATVEAFDDATADASELPLLDVNYKDGAATASVGPLGGIFKLAGDGAAELAGLELWILPKALESETTVTVRAVTDGEHFGYLQFQAISAQFEIGFSGISKTKLPIGIWLPCSQQPSENQSMVVISKSGDVLHYPSAVAFDRPTGRAFAMTDEFSIFGAFIGSIEPTELDFDPITDSFSEYDNSGKFVTDNGDLDTQGTCLGVSWFVKHYWLNYRKACGPLAERFVDRPKGGDVGGYDERYIAVYLQKRYSDLSWWQQIGHKLYGLQELVSNVSPLNFENFLNQFPFRVRDAIADRDQPVLTVISWFDTDGSPEIKNHAVLAYKVTDDLEILLLDPNKPKQTATMVCRLGSPLCTYSTGATSWEVLPYIPVVTPIDTVRQQDDPFVQAMSIEHGKPGALACAGVCRDAYDAQDCQEGMPCTDFLDCTQQGDGYCRNGSPIVLNCCTENDLDTCLDFQWVHCGDNICGLGETPENCPQDCSCARDCRNRECGPDPVCGQSCGTCGTDRVCDDNGRCIARPDTDVEWVRIEGGSFSMGSDDDDSWGNEQPVHRVTVPTFEMSRTEVTFKQYQACVSAGGCTAVHVDDGTCYVWTGSNWEQGTLPSSFQGDDQPVVCVDWDQAQAFASWAGGRLPSEAEWEYAARSGGRDWKYPWGDEEATCERAVMWESSTGDGCGLDSTWPVCSKPSGNTTQGLCDMAGNVWEWVQDWYYDTYDGAPTDGSAWESPTGSTRVDRGGSWYDYARFVRAASRGGSLPGNRRGYVGFRLARSVR